MVSSDSREKPQQWDREAGSEGRESLNIPCSQDHEVLMKLLGRGWGRGAGSAGKLVELT